MSLSISAASRRTVAIAALSMIAAGGAVLATQAKADGPVCTQTDYFQDGHFLTAATEGSTTGPVDATGCDIGVYFGPNSTGTVDDVTIGGPSAPTYYGVLVNGGNVTVTNSQINDVGDQPQHDGSQHGVGIAFVNDATGSVSNTGVSNYQKDGILASGDGTSVSISGNQVSGSGPVPYIAQNGIQVSSGASGSVVGNEIDNNYYTGCSSRDAAQTGCTAWVSTGLLLYGVDASSVKASNNKFRGDQRNQALITSSSLS